MTARIEDYGIVGNMKSCALVTRDGTVEWMCLPRFDSEACMAALLGTDQNGTFAFRPTVPIERMERRYLEDSLVLETKIFCAGGSFKILDFMALEPERDELVRIVEGMEGQVSLEVQLDPRFGYGSEKPFIRMMPDSIKMVAGPDSLDLRSNLPMKPLRQGGLGASLSLKAGQRVTFSLSWRPSHLEALPPADPDRQLKNADTFWKTWAGRCTYEGPYRDLVVRSLLTLKALTYAPTGGIAAAPTTSLPEEIGGIRNWDYRFSWLRDGALTLLALLNSGYEGEARAWADWLIRAVSGDPAQAQIMYGLAGERRLTEYEVDWLPGYEGSLPVHIGNAASEQFQLDVYGEVVAAVDLARRTGLKPRAEAWGLVVKLMDHLESVWQLPDDGIWEVRGGRRHFTHSKLMAWVAFDRAVKMIEEGPFSSEPDHLAAALRYRGIRERIHRDICERGYNPEVKAFSQYYGSTALDAAVLVMGHFGFLPPTDPRMTSTVAAIEKGLMRDGFVLRYATTEGSDGLKGSEGAFLPCSFWLVDNLAMQGRLEDAYALYERLTSLVNDLGLIAEEYEPRLKRQVGNFPQAFTHVGIVGSAHVLAAAEAARKGKGPPPTQLLHGVTFAGAH